jgi:hypothetical protein
MRDGPIRCVSTLEIMLRQHGAPLARNFHVDPGGRGALVLLAQFAAVLIVAAAAIVLIDSVLIGGVVALVMFLRSRPCQRIEQ